jgi:hypothetical protein
LLYENVLQIVVFYYHQILMMAQALYEKVVALFLHSVYEPQLG